MQKLLSMNTNSYKTVRDVDEDTNMFLLIISLKLRETMF